MNTCRYCRANFEISNKTGFCSRCLVMMCRERERARYEPISEMIANFIPRFKKCEWCQEDYFAKTVNFKQMFCGKDCREEAEKNWKKGWYDKTKIIKVRKVKLRFEVFKRDNFTCTYCGRTVPDGAKLELDHIIPKSKGGQDTFENYTTSCWECNHGKLDSDITENSQK